jgi:predicted PurR-regulated permease PerM
MTDSQKWLVFSFIAAITWLIYLLSPVLTPFVFATMLAYLGDPLADKLETYRLSRTQAVIVVFLAMSLVLIPVLLWLPTQLEAQIARFLGSLPVYAKWLNETAIPWFHQRLGFEIHPLETDAVINAVKSHWQKAGGIVTAIIGSLSHSGQALAAWLMNLLLIPVITFYLLRDWDSLMIKIHDLLPKRIAPAVSRLAGEFDTVLSAFIRGQLYVMLALGCIYSIGLWLTGLDLALVIGMLAGLISFVPYLGAVVGIVMAAIAALVQFHDLFNLAWVALVFIVGQSLEGMVLTPMLVGDKIGLHPVAVIFAIMAGGQLFGFLGVLLALPAASIIMVLLRHAHEFYKDSDFYGQL